MKDAEMKAEFHLNGPKKDEIIAIIGLLDLYEAKFNYPKNVSMPYEKHDWAKKYMEEKVVKQEKYFQFFAVHETEAWLLSDSAIFPSEFRNALDKIKLPEAVNFDEPPAKLLHRLYRHQYRKTTHGPELFGKLNPQVAYTKCPKLKALLDKMLELAQLAMKQ